METKRKTMLGNYNFLLSEMNGDEEKTRTCLKYMAWLIRDIEIFNKIDLEDYKNIWTDAFNYSCK